jgi:hypothetical protein
VVAHNSNRNQLTGVLLINLEELVDLLTNLTVGHADIVLGVTVVVHEGEEAIVRDVELQQCVSISRSILLSFIFLKFFIPGLGSTYKLVLTTGDVGDIHVVSGGGKIFVLLGSEDVNGDKVDLGVTVLASLGGGHVDNLAGAALDHDEAVLAQSRALHGVGERRAGVGGLEGGIML